MNRWNQSFTAPHTIEDRIVDAVQEIPGRLVGAAYGWVDAEHVREEGLIALKPRIGHTDRIAFELGGTAIGTLAAVLACRV